jgi:outer membrane lipoprotein-sorting protein
MKGSNKKLKISSMKCSPFLLLLVCLSACTNPKLTLNTEKVSFNELLDFIDAEQNKIKTLQASCRISVDSEEFSGNFFASVYYTAHDSLYISVSGPFGIQGGTLFVGKERFIFYNQISNKFYNGAIADFEDQNFFQFPLRLKELINIFAAKEKLPSMKIKNYRIEQDLYVVESTNQSDQYTIRIDPAIGHITRLELDSGNGNSFIREYSNFLRDGALYFPRKIDMIRAEKKQAVSIFYTQLLLNEEIEPSRFLVKIADTAEQMNYIHE